MTETVVVSPGAIMAVPITPTAAHTVVLDLPVVGPAMPRMGASAALRVPMVACRTAVSAATLAASAAFRAPSVSADLAALLPAGFAADAAMLAPSVSVGAEVAPTPLTAVAALLAPTAAGGWIVQPPQITAAAELRTPAVEATVGVTPTALTASAALLTPTVASGLIVAPVPLAASAQFSAPTVTVGAIVAPTALNAAASLQTPTVSTGLLVQPAPLAASALLAAPTVSAGAAAAPTPFVATSALLAPTAVGSVNIQPAPLAATAQLRTPAVSVGYGAAPAALTATAALRTPVAGFGVNVAVLVRMQATAQGIAPESIAATTTITGGGPFGATAQLLAPSVSLSVGTINLSPPVMTATSALRAPAVSTTTPGPIVQSNSGVSTGTSFNVTLPAATNASNRVVVFVAGNTTVTTPAGFTSRASQVNEMGHYLYDRAGDGSTSYAFTNANGQLTWVAIEIAGGAFVAAPTGQNSPSGSATYTTQTVTPTAGNRLIVASIGSSIGSATVRTVSGWTNGFVELADLCQPSADYPMQGVATLQVTANGSTAYSTGATYSASSTGRSALIAAYSHT